MALNRLERKERLGYGAATKLAKRTQRTVGHVSQVLNCERSGRRDATVENAAARMVGLKRFDLFPPVGSDSMRGAA